MKKFERWTVAYRPRTNGDTLLNNIQPVSHSAPVAIAAPASSQSNLPHHVIAVLAFATAFFAPVVNVWLATAFFLSISVLIIARYCKLMSSGSSKTIGSMMPVGRNGVGAGASKSNAAGANAVLFVSNSLNFLVPQKRMFPEVSLTT